MNILLGAIILVNIIFNIVVYRNQKNLVRENFDKATKEESRRIRAEEELRLAKKEHEANTKEINSENKMYKVIMEDLEKTLSKYTEEERFYYSQMDSLDEKGKEITPAELLKLKDLSSKGGSGVHDFTGVYILQNKTEDKFYIGQSISVLKRASKHFLGEGNKGVYEDYMNGAEWTIKMVALSDSGFKSINALEKHFIKYHSATYNGYNKTVGNVN